MPGKFIMASALQEFHYNRHRRSIKF